MAARTTNGENQSTFLLSNVFGSATAGIIGRLLTHPLDTAKARLQSLSGAHYTGPVDAIVNTFRSEGLYGLYRGFPTVIAGGTPGTIIYLCGYDYFKDNISPFISPFNALQVKKDDEENFAIHFAAGFLAETVACVIYVPVDVIKERLQIQCRTDAVQYKGGWDALRKICKTEGTMGIYKGYGATLASFGPFSALYFVFYEKFKSWSKIYQQQSHENMPSTVVPLQFTILSSASAGAIASFLTSPLDMAKLRLQVQRGAEASSFSASKEASLASKTKLSFGGMSDALIYSYRLGGIPGLFRGAGARVLHFVPLNTVIMTIYETCRSFFYRNLS
eukprot:jgi/Psemu1/307365/fgenesh1_kg.323_\